MENFEFYAPTKVVFGRGTESKTGSLVCEFAGKGSKILLHYGMGSVERSGLLDRVRSSLKESGIEFVELGGVRPNPRLSMARKGIEICRENGINFILAVGGGSAIDSAKCIGYGLASPGVDVWDFYCRKARPKACAGVGVVLTIAAAGSEMSESSVITNDENGNLKRGCSSDYSRPKFAVMNPELTATLPPYQTASGCVDIIMHTLERFFCVPHTSKINDELSAALIRVVMENAKILQRDPKNYDARAEIMWAGSLSHNGFTGDRFIGDWACHQLEHELSGMFDVPHGAGLSAIWGTWARYVLNADAARFAKLARMVFGISGKSVVDAALDGICRMENFFSDIGMPTGVSGLNIKPSQPQIQELARKCSFDGTRTIGAIKKLDEEDIRNIYTLASERD